MKATPPNIISEIEKDIRDIEINTFLYDEINFSERAEAIDFIDFHVIQRSDGLLYDSASNPQLIALKQQAEQLKSTLESIDLNLFEKLRENIKTGVYEQSSFVEMVSKYLGYNVADATQQSKIGYDNLDTFTNGILSYNIIPEPTGALEQEMVFYQKTPTRIIFQLAAEIKTGDVFFDLGSGLGQAAILMNLISGATAKGIEYEPAYFAYAKECALELNLNNVEFINIDARKGDYSVGTTFFMYTPFEGQILQDVLQLLKKEAQARPIRIFTYGPCSQIVAQQSWLSCVNGVGEEPYMLYEFRRK